MKPENPRPDDYFELAGRNGGSIFIVGMIEEESQWASGYPTVYGSTCGFTLGLFISNYHLRLDKPTIFFDNSWNQIKLTPEQQQQFDANWEAYMEINRSMDLGGGFGVGFLPRLCGWLALSKHLWVVIHKIRLLRCDNLHHGRFEVGEFFGIAIRRFDLVSHQKAPLKLPDSS
jgi:hypothetical protein